MERREFLRRSLAATAAVLGTGAAAGAGLTAWPHHLLAAATAGKAKQASDSIRLGPRGLRVSRLAMGTGTNGAGGRSDQTRRLGLGGLASLFQLGFDQGLTFWDSADQYGSHPHLREALRRGIPREKVTILTKTHATTAAEMRADLDRFRRELGTDYLDVLLLHCLTDDDWPERKRAAMDVISEAQERGVVRTKGVSCHTFGALRAAARSPWVEVDLARINPAGVAMDADAPSVVGVLREMKAAGKGVIGMKILGAGELRGRADECLQFALALDCVDCFTIGAESPAELLDLTRKIPAASQRA